MEFRFPLWVIFLPMVLAFVAVILAGPAMQRRFEQEDDSDLQRRFGYLTAPAVSLTTLLLSFTLVTVWSSFQHAIERTAQEARTVDYMNDSAELIKDPVAPDLVAATICYARAVVGPEWQAMEAGAAFAPEVGEWTTRIEDAISRLSVSKTGNTPLAREVIMADRERGLARSQRMSEARVSVPTLVMLLLTIFAALAITALGLALVPEKRRTLMLVTLGVIVLMFAGALEMISELDSPFYGLIDIEPLDMERVAAADVAGFAERFPGQELPCDEQGRVRSP